MHFKRTYFFLVLFFSAGILNAQMDSINLLCPLPNGTMRIIRASDRNYEKTSEYGVILTSRTDTLIQAVHESVVVILTQTEDKKYDIVLSYRGYYFWYTGVTDPKVRE